MADNDFLYKLNIDSNASKVLKELQEVSKLKFDDQKKLGVDVTKLEINRLSNETKLQIEASKFAERSGIREEKKKEKAEKAGLKEKDRLLKEETKNIKAKEKLDRAQARRNKENFRRGLGIASAIATAIGLSARKTAQSFTTVGAVATATGEEPQYLREIGQEYKNLGFQKQEGLNYIQNLSRQIRGFSIGKGKFLELSILGINDPLNIKNAKQFDELLRKSFARDPKQFRLVSESLGFSNQDITRIAQTQPEYLSNRDIAREQVINTKQTLEDTKEFNSAIGKLSANFTKLGQASLKITTSFIKLSEGFLGKTTRAVNLLSGNIPEGSSTTKEALSLGYDFATSSTAVSSFMTSQGLNIANAIKEGISDLFDSSDNNQKVVTNNTTVIVKSVDELKTTLKVVNDANERGN